MSSLVIYDSSYGNTERIARVIAETIGARLIHVSEAGKEDLDYIDQLIVGSPTQGGRPTRLIQEYISSLAEGSLITIKVGAFDTRVDVPRQNLFLRILLKTIGFAAPKIERALVSKGGNIYWESTGFIVDGKEGPLKEGEQVRAAEWATQPRLELRMI